MGSEKENKKWSGLKLGKLLSPHNKGGVKKRRPQANKSEGKQSPQQDSSTRGTWKAETKNLEDASRRRLFTSKKLFRRRRPQSESSEDGTTESDRAMGAQDKGLSQKRSSSGALDLIRQRVFSPPMKDSNTRISAPQDARETSESFWIDPFFESAEFSTPSSRRRSLVRPPSMVDLSTQGTQSSRTEDSVQAIHSATKKSPDKLMEIKSLPTRSPRPMVIGSRKALSALVPNLSDDKSHDTPLFDPTLSQKLKIGLNKSKEKHSKDEAPRSPRPMAARVARHGASADASIPLPNIDEDSESPPFNPTLSQKLRIGEMRMNGPPLDSLLSSSSPNKHNTPSIASSTHCSSTTVKVSNTLTHKNSVAAATLHRSPESSPSKRQYHQANGSPDGRSRASVSIGHSHRSGGIAHPPMTPSDRSKRTLDRTSRSRSRTPDASREAEPKGQSPKKRGSKELPKYLASPKNTTSVKTTSAKMQQSKVRASDPKKNSPSYKLGIESRSRAGQPREVERKRSMSRESLPGTRQVERKPSKTKTSKSREGHIHISLSPESEGSQPKGAEWKRSISHEKGTGKASSRQPEHHHTRRPKFRDKTVSSPTQTEGRRPRCSDVRITDSPKPLKRTISNEVKRGTGASLTKVEPRKSTTHAPKSPSGSHNAARRVSWDKLSVSDALPVGLPPEVSRSDAATTMRMLSKAELERLGESGPFRNPTPHTPSHRRSRIASSPQKRSALSEAEHAKSYKAEEATRLSSQDNAKHSRGKSSPSSSGREARRTCDPPVRRISPGQRHTKSAQCESDNPAHEHSPSEKWRDLLHRNSVHEEDGKRDSDIPFSNISAQQRKFCGTPVWNKNNAQRDVRSPSPSPSNGRGTSGIFLTPESRKPPIRKSPNLTPSHYAAVNKMASKGFVSPLEDPPGHKSSSQRCRRATSPFSVASPSSSVHDNSSRSRTSTLRRHLRRLEELNSSFRSGSVVYNQSGHDRSGHSRSGHDQSGHSRSGHDRSGHSRSGSNRSGHSRSGNNRSGHNRSTHSHRSSSSRHRRSHNIPMDQQRSPEYSSHSKQRINTNVLKDYMTSPTLNTAPLTDDRTLERLSRDKSSSRHESPNRSRRSLYGSSSGKKGWKNPPEIEEKGVGVIRRKHQPRNTSSLNELGDSLGSLPYPGEHKSTTPKSSIARYHKEANASFLSSPKSESTAES